MVSIQDTISDPVELCYGVPQGSVLGPILFILYTQTPTHVILNHPVSHMLYADDTQVYKSCNINDLASAILCVEKCVSYVKTWMLLDKLQKNEDKTEVLLVTPKRVVTFPEFININGTSVEFCLSLRNLGITLDSTLSLHQHVLNVCRGAFLELWHINSIHNFLTTDAVKTLFVHRFCHVLTIVILHLQVFSASFRICNMCKMLEQRWFFGHQNCIISRPFFKSFTGYPLDAE